jgi:hypothetical protein
MGFSSEDDFLSELTGGKQLRVDGAKLTTPVHTAGGWHSLAGLAGSPNASTYPGTDLVWSNCSEQNGDGTAFPGFQHGGVVTPDTKHITTVGAGMVAAAGAPWQAKLVDLQGYYRLSTTNVTGTGSRVLVNSEAFTANAGTDILTYTSDWKNYTKVRFTTTTTLPAGLALLTDYWLVRQSATTAKVASSFANAIANTTIDITDTGVGTHTLTIQMPRYDSGVGCESFFVVQTAPTLGGPNITASDYTNTAGTTGRAWQGSPGMNAAADSYAARILHSGNAAGKYGPFLPRQGADLGTARVNSFTWSGGTAYTGSGVVALCIARPLLDISIPVSGMWSERDLKSQLPSMPEVKPGACLVWLLYGTGATTTNSPFTSAIDFVWG